MIDVSYVLQTVGLFSGLCYDDDVMLWCASCYSVGAILSLDQLSFVTYVSAFSLVFKRP